MKWQGLRAWHERKEAEKQIDQSEREGGGDARPVTWIFLSCQQRWPQCRAQAQWWHHGPVRAGLLSVEWMEWFTGSAGCFPEPQVIHFTFLSGVLAVHTEAHSNYMDTNRQGSRTLCARKPGGLPFLQAVTKPPCQGPGGCRQGAVGAGKHRGEELFGLEGHKSGVDVHSWRWSVWKPGSSWSTEMF